MKLSKKEITGIRIGMMLLIGILFFMFVLPHINATEQYQSSKPINLQFTCTLNNAIPSPSTIFNISIYYQNGDTLINNAQTTPQGSGSFNYSVIFPSNELYKVKMFCTDGNYSYSSEGSYLINPTGTTLDSVQISIYIFFLILCLILIFLSVRIFKKNRFSKDAIKESEMYKIKKRNEFVYYMEVLKKHFWIVGIFGVYLGLLIFTAILDQLVYNLGLTDIENVLKYVVLGFAWGLIPFMLFWFVWLIIVIYKSTTETLKYQFGKLGRNE